MFKPKQSYLIRTVTYHLVGTVVGESNGFLCLKNASWVADSGRFGEALANGTLAEVEYVGEALVNRASIVDAFPWKHALPAQSK